MNISEETYLQTGRRLGPYQLLSPLDQRGAIEVWQAQHIDAHIPIALKILRRDGLWEEELQHHEMRLHDEARVLASLHHPHIVKYYGYGVSRHVRYIAMQYAARGSVIRYHSQGRKLPLSLVRFYVWQIGHALYSLHQRGLIHRDVKPGNILLLHSRHALLADFGLAMSDPSLRYPRSLHGGGTTAYMPPEQYHGLPCRASDQYGLATCVYEWLTGHRPFSGETELMMSRREHFKPLQVSKFRPELPSAVDEIILTALHRDPTRRHATVLEFARKLVDATRVSGSPRQRKQSYIQDALASDLARLPTGLPSTTSLSPNTGPRGLRKWVAFQR